MVAATVALGYLLLAFHQGLGAGRWNSWRTTVFVLGSGVLAWGSLPQYLPFAGGDFRKHMLQHLMLGMLGPLGWVMGAPMTLLLRSTPTRWARHISSLLRSRPLQGLANPVTALVLNIGGMGVLYFTPLYTQMMTHPSLEHLVHFHLIAAGCLYTWVIAGPDPAPRKLPVPTRLVVLGVAVVAHSVMAQLLYAAAFVRISVPLTQLQQGAELMYYGGDITEMLLAVALVTAWRPVHRTAASTGPPTASHTAVPPA